MSLKIFFLKRPESNFIENKIDEVRHSSLSLCNGVFNKRIFSLSNFFASLILLSTMLLTFPHSAFAWANPLQSNFWNGAQEANSTGYIEMTNALAEPGSNMWLTPVMVTGYPNTYRCFFKESGTFQTSIGCSSGSVNIVSTRYYTGDTIACYFDGTYLIAYINGSEVTRAACTISSPQNFSLAYSSNGISYGTISYTPPAEPTPTLTPTPTPTPEPTLTPTPTSTPQTVNIGNWPTTAPTPTEIPLPTPFPAYTFEYDLTSESKINRLVGDSTISIFGDYIIGNDAVYFTSLGNYGGDVVIERDFVQVSKMSLTVGVEIQKVAHQFRSFITTNGDLWEGIDIDENGYATFWDCDNNFENCVATKKDISGVHTISIDYIFSHYYDELNYSPVYKAYYYVDDVFVANQYSQAGPMSMTSAFNYSTGYKYVDSPVSTYSSVNYILLVINGVQFTDEASFSSLSNTSSTFCLLPQPFGLRNLNVGDWIGYYWCLLKKFLIEFPSHLALGWSTTKIQIASIPQNILDGITDLFQIDDELLADSFDTALTRTFTQFSTPIDDSLTYIIIAPLNTISALSTSTCSDVEIPVPFLTGETLILPCGRKMLNDNFPDIVAIWDTVSIGLLSYWLIVHGLSMVKSSIDPDESKIQVTDI